jgi:hypothetical protein
MLGVASQIGGKVIAEGVEPLTVTTVMTDSTLLVAGTKLLSCPNLIAAMCRLSAVTTLASRQVGAV